MGQKTEMYPVNLQDFDNWATTYLEIWDVQTAERVLQAVLAPDEHHAVALNLYGILEIQRRTPIGPDDLLRSRSSPIQIGLDPC